MVYGGSDGLLSCQINVTLCLMKSGLWEEDSNSFGGFELRGVALPYTLWRLSVFPDSPYQQHKLDLSPVRADVRGRVWFIGILSYLFPLGNDVSCYDEIFRVLNCTTILQGWFAPDRGIITTLNHSALRSHWNIWKKARFFQSSIAQFRWACVHCSPRTFLLANVVLIL